MTGATPSLSSRIVTQASWAPRVDYLTRPHLSGAVPAGDGDFGMAPSRMNGHREPAWENDRSLPIPQQSLIVTPGELAGTKRLTAIK